MNHDISFSPARYRYILYPLSAVDSVPRFNQSETDVENAIVTSTGQFVIAWDFNKVKKGLLDKYEIKKYEREATKQAPKALKDVHPIGKAPIITDGDITLPESGAIIEYIITKYGEGKVHTPTEGKALADELYCKPPVPWRILCEPLTTAQTSTRRRARSCRLSSTSTSAHSSPRRRLSSSAQS